ncbi:hypothetical protein SAMN03159382_05924 [Pseudomonas sp. NFACC23-1]|nr:hypothetical protein SAMN03159386_03531 [Pseudomonas sp. NFACC17-2]SEJ99096.1 hypothetical protein SAMN03159382_05924 [Pseudomonas sp. NFACC23-1]SFW50964.1 hypothetical protein SAMN05660640_01756 [Pseudomonas sp. NFACC16-2]
MSRSLGLREDQRVREVLVMRIAGLFPLDPVRCYREQARSQRSATVPVKADLLAMASARTTRGLA